MHPLLVNCLRVTVGAPAENQAMLAALADALKSLPAPAPAPASAAPASAASISAAPEA
jgi:hypothetical protein